MELSQMIPKNGLLGYFFEKQNFQDLLFISKGSYTHTKLQPNLDFIRPEQTIQAVRWLGRIKPIKKGKYLFSTSENKNVVLQIESQNTGKKVIINQGQRYTIDLEANTFYSIRLEYQLNNPVHIENMTLSFYWHLAGDKQEIVPTESIYLPDFSKGLGIPDLSDTLFDTEAAKLEPEVTKGLGISDLSSTVFNVEADTCLSDLCTECSFQDEPECQTPPCKALCKNGNPQPKPKPKPEPKPKSERKVIRDSDSDGIPDEMEISGYVFSHVYDASHQYYKVYPWLPAYDRNPVYYQYQKYVSNPYIKNTAGDPYTDLEKAGRSVYIKGKVLTEAYHPLVAACPSVSVFMERIILIPKVNADKKEANGISFQTSYGIESLNMSRDRTSISYGTSLEFGGDLQGRKNRKRVGAHVSGQLEGGIYISKNLTKSDMQTSITTSTVQEKQKHSEADHKMINSMDSAVLSGVIRYCNMGTAPIADVQPSLSFIVEDKPVTSFTPKEKIYDLEPGHSYPDGLMGIVVTSADLFNGHPTSIDKDQLERILAGNPVEIQATQIKGTFMGTGEIFPTDKPVEWTKVLPGIYEKTATLILETPDGTLYRRIAAPPKEYMTPLSSIPESHTPHLTLEQAIQIAFGARKDNRGDLMMTTPNGMTYKLNRYNVNVYVNKKTDDLIVEQLKAFKEKGDNTKSIYDVTLTKEMVILIKPILEVNAFLNNDYLYIENKTDESLSYSVWREAGSSSKLLKQGIVPSDSTIGTGYLCGNKTEELYISVSKRVSQVIFKGRASDLAGFERNTLQPIGQALHLPSPTTIPLDKWSYHIESWRFYVQYLNGGKSDIFAHEIRISPQDDTVIVPIRDYGWSPSKGSGDPTFITELHYEYEIDNVKMPEKIIKDPTTEDRKKGRFPRNGYTECKLELEIQKKDQL